MSGRLASRQAFNQRFGVYNQVDSQHWKSGTHEAEPVTNFGTEFRNATGNIPTARRLPPGLHSGTGFRDAEGPDFKARLFRSETYDFGGIGFFAWPSNAQPV